MQGKVMSQDNASSSHDVGIDVCKDFLDVDLIPANVAERFSNDKKGHQALLQFLKRHRVRRILMEATGKYHRSVHERLHRAGYAVVIVNPARARKFAESIGKLAKTDKVDARMLAHFAGWTGHEASMPLAENLASLQEIVRSRAGTIADRVALLNELRSSTTAVVKQELRRRIAACKAATKRLEAAAREIIAADAALQRRFDILVSIPGVGTATAASLIADMSELGTLDEKEVGLLSGLAPIAADSGERQGQRRIMGGRRRVRTACYMPALHAARSNPPLKTFYRHLLAAGKAKKVALTAVMRKLLITANALLRDNRLWSLTAPKNETHQAIPA